MALPYRVPVVGLDLSLTAAGIATPRGLHTIGAKGKAGATLLERRTRLRLQADQVLATVIGEPDDRPLVVIEAPAHSRTVGQQHDRSGLWWLIVDALFSDSTVAYVVEVSPSARAKYATGRGNAAKADVLLSVARRFPDQDVTNDNEADALLLRAMALDHYGHPLVEMPAKHREALVSVKWPDL